MSSLIIILKDKMPSFCTYDVSSDIILYEGIEYKKKENWVGLFYDYTTYWYDKTLFLSSVIYNFSAVNIDKLLLKSIQKLSYLNYEQGFDKDLISTIELKIFTRKYSDKLNQIEFQHSQCFGNDYLFVNEERKSYCFVFPLPSDINIPTP